METTKCLDHEVTVGFDYSPAQRESRTDPSFPSEVEIYSIAYKGIELIEKYTQEELQDLAGEICEEYEEAEEEEAQYAADCKYDEMKEEDL